MNESILLTGGSGFFGRRIAEALRRHEYEVARPAVPSSTCWTRARPTGS